MSFQDFTDKVRRMSPLARAFTSAALGVPAFGLVIAASMMAPGLATIAGLAVSLGGSIVVSSYSDPTRGGFNIGNMHLSKDSLLNIGAFFGSYIFVAPKLVGAALGMMLAVNASGDLPQTADLAQAENPAPIVQTMTGSEAADSVAQFAVVESENGGCTEPGPYKKGPITPQSPVFA